MKQTEATSFLKSSDIGNSLDDDALIAKTILGISTLQLDMMGKMNKLEENQKTILEEVRLERAKHHAVVDALEKHHDKEMGRFMELVNLLVEAMNRREQGNTTQTFEAARLGSQNNGLRANQISNIGPGAIPPFQTANPVTAQPFFSSQTLSQVNPMQPIPGFVNSSAVSHQQISNLQQLLQSQQYQLMHHQLAQAQQVAPAQLMPGMNLSGARAVQSGAASFDPSLFSSITSASSSIPNAKPTVPAAETCPVISKPSAITTAPIFKPPAQDSVPASSLSFRPLGPASIFGGPSAGGFPPQQDLSYGKQEDDVEEFEPTAHFEPVVPLPALIEAKTGEEDERVLFKSRSKLFRFVKSSSEYKERGIGDIKILKAVDGKCRIVMRRDQVLKVCANVPLRIGMRISKKPGSENTCMWACKDYSESEEGTDECFAARFKTPQLADEFMETFRKAVEPGVVLDGSTKTENEQKIDNESCKQLKALLVQPELTTSSAGSKGASVASKSAAEEPGKNSEKGFGDAFKPAPGSWECKSCYTRNKAEANVCPCCGTKKDGSIAGPTSSGSLPTSKFAATTAANKEGAFSFGITAGVPFPKNGNIPLSSGNGFTTKSISFGFSPSKAASGTAVQELDASTVQEATVSTPGLPSFSFAPLTVSKSSSVTGSFSNICVPSVSKPDTTTTAAAKTEPLFTFPKPVLPVSSASSSVASKPTFSFSSSVQKASDQDVLKGPSAFSFKAVDTKSQTSAPTFGGSPVFGGKSLAVATKDSGSLVMAKPLGKSLFGASAGTSPFSSSVFGAGSSGGFAALAAKAQSEIKPVTNESTEHKITPFQDGSLISEEKSIFSIGAKQDVLGKDGQGIKQEEEVEEFIPTAQFEPVIPLPALVETMTGEEDEKVLLKIRAKLFRFVKASNEYKERGIGDIKILQNSGGACRIVMRRDQVLKVCANSPIRAGMTISKKPNTDNTCMWACKDYSENTSGSDEIFVARFKTSQLADQFIDVFRQASGGLTANTSRKQSSDAVKTGTVEADEVPSSSKATSDSKKIFTTGDALQEEDYDEEVTEYEELKDFPVVVHVTDAFPSPMKPSKQMEIKGMYAIGIRRDVNAMEVDVLDSEGEAKLTHSVTKDDKFFSTGADSLEYITATNEGKNVKVSVKFVSSHDKEEALSHLHKGVNMAAENED